MSASNVAVNDLNTAYAPGYGLMNASIGYRFIAGHMDVNTFLRLNNIFDHSYVGSVIVNETNGRFYEPSPRRNMTIGIQASLQF